MTKESSWQNAGSCLEPSRLLFTRRSSACASTAPSSPPPWEEEGAASAAEVLPALRKRVADSVPEAGLLQLRWQHFIDPLWLGCVSVVRATVNSGVSYFLLLCCVLNISVCCSKEPGAVGWDLIEQVKTATSSIQTSVPLIRAFLEGGKDCKLFAAKWMLVFVSCLHTAYP